MQVSDCNFAQTPAEMLPYLGDSPCNQSLHYIVFHIPKMEQHLPFRLILGKKKFAIFNFVTRSQSLTTPSTISHIEMVTLPGNSVCILETPDTVGISDTVGTALQAL